MKLLTNNAKHIIMCGGPYHHERMNPVDLVCLEENDRRGFGVDFDSKVLASSFKISYPTRQFSGRNAGGNVPESFPPDGCCNVCWSAQVTRRRLNMAFPSSIHTTISSTCESGFSLLRARGHDHELAHTCALRRSAHRNWTCIPGVCITSGVF
jgi:hypothetical protein